MKKNDQYTPVRFSHLTAYAGVGSIVRDNNDFTMVITDIRYWRDKNGKNITHPIRLVERVKQHLNITKELRMPPTAQVNGEKVIGAPLPGVIFPSYVKCKHCNRLHHKPWYRSEQKISKDLVCYHCGRADLEQVTWCCVSSGGDLRDVPWHYICHQNSNSKCEYDYTMAYLEIIPGLRGKKIVRCTRCGASHTFEQADIKFSEKCQPWMKTPRDGEPQIYTVMEINDPRVYSANKKRAIVIPPESNVDKNSIVYKLESNDELLNNIQNESRKLKRKKILISAANDFRCTVEDIKKALSEIELGQSHLNNITAGEMYSDEYSALISEDDFNEEANFVTEHKTKAWNSYLKEMPVTGKLKTLSGVINDVVAVNRLKVIEIFSGFSRKASDYEGVDIEVPPDITGELDWLPAIELFGEGIFFTLNQPLLNEWESLHEIRLRAKELNERYEHSTQGSFENLAVVSPRFILLHTLAHLIIRELEISAGYPAASLKERIYSSQSENMAGILIYTAVPDIAGSLGGIVEAAEPKNFLKLIDGAFKHAQWCSLDPVCSEHEGQGPGLLNRSACHACALIPETSCEYGNVLLDRVFIKGNERLNIPSLLNVKGKIDG